METLRYGGKPEGSDRGEMLASRRRDLVEKVPLGASEGRGQLVHTYGYRVGCAAHDMFRTGSCAGFVAGDRFGKRLTVVLLFELANVKFSLFDHSGLVLSYIFIVK